MIGLFPSTTTTTTTTMIWVLAATWPTVNAFAPSFKPAVLGASQSIRRDSFSCSSSALEAESSTNSRQDGSASSSSSSDDDANAAASDGGGGQQEASISPVLLPCLAAALFDDDGFYKITPYKGIILDVQNDDDDDDMNNKANYHSAAAARPPPPRNDFGDYNSNNGSYDYWDASNNNNNAQTSRFDASLPSWSDNNQVVFDMEQQRAAWTQQIMEIEKDDDDDELKDEQTGEEHHQDNHDDVERQEQDEQEEDEHHQYYNALQQQEQQQQAQSYFWPSSAKAAGWGLIGVGGHAYPSRDQRKQQQRQRQAPSVSSTPSTRTSSQITSEGNRDILKKRLAADFEVSFDEWEPSPVLLPRREEEEQVADEMIDNDNVAAAWMPEIPEQEKPSLPMTTNEVSPANGVDTSFPTTTPGPSLSSKNVYNGATAPFFARKDPPVLPQPTTEPETTDSVGETAGTTTTTNDVVVVEQMVDALPKANGVSKAAGISITTTTDDNEQTIDTVESNTSVNGLVNGVVATNGVVSEAIDMQQPAVNGDANVVVGADDKDDDRTLSNTLATVGGMALIFGAASVMGEVGTLAELSVLGAAAAALFGGGGNSKNTDNNGVDVEAASTHDDPQSPDTATNDLADYDNDDDSEPPTFKESRHNADLASSRKL